MPIDGECHWSCACGNEALELLVVYDVSGTGYIIHCPQCGANSMISRNREDAWRAWDEEQEHTQWSRMNG